MAQEFAHKLPEGIPSKCDTCGFRPRKQDVGIICPEMTGNEIVYHVRCYHCGMEWVD
jgi:hypothetical protein